MVQDKTTSKLRIVYDTSAKMKGLMGSSFGQSIFDVPLRFSFHQIALAGDIEKAFLMVLVQEKDCDSLLCEQEDA